MLIAATSDILEKVHLRISLEYVFRRTFQASDERAQDIRIAKGIEISQPAFRQRFRSSDICVKNVTFGEGIPFRTQNSHELLPLANLFFFFFHPNKQQIATPARASTTIKWKRRFFNSNGLLTICPAEENTRQSKQSRIATIIR